MLYFKMNMPLYLMALYGSIMILSVLVLRKAFKNRLPKFVFPVLWGLVLIRLLVPFSLSSPISAPVPEWTLPSMQATEAVIVEDHGSPDVSQNFTGMEQAAAGTADSKASVTVIQSRESGILGGAAGLDRRVVLPVLFFLGAAVTAAILYRQKKRYADLMKNSLLVEHNETINEILRSAGCGHVLVFTNDHIASPLVSGIFNPRIYLPAGMSFENLPLLRHILLHEVMHIKRKDNWMKALMLAAICLHWYNPLVWVMSKKLSADMEAACDAALLDHIGMDERQGYAGSLLAMAVTASRQTLLYSAFSRTEVERRIRNVLDYKKASAFLTILSVTLILTCTAVFASGGQAPFARELSGYCGSDSSRWSAKAELTRDIALGDQAQRRADYAIFDAMKEDKTDDPDILEKMILSALSREFGVEKGAFRLAVELNPDAETLAAEYAAQGIAKGPDGWYLYQGRPVRTYTDEMLGTVQTREDGTVDIRIIRDRMGEIASVAVLRKGDSAFDKRTKEIEREKYSRAAEGRASATASEATIVVNE